MSNTMTGIELVEKIRSYVSKHPYPRESESIKNEYIRLDKLLRRIGITDKENTVLTKKYGWSYIEGFAMLASSLELEQKQKNN